MPIRLRVIRFPPSGPSGRYLGEGAAQPKHVAPLTGLSGDDLSGGYEAASGKQWTQQLGATMSLFNAGFAALGEAANAKNEEALARALSTLKTESMAGRVDFTKGPIANVSSMPILGGQWVSDNNRTFEYELVVTDNSLDRSVPVSAKLAPYNVVR